MRKNWNNKGRITLCLLFLTLSSLLLALCLILPENANSGPYINSAHGTSYGVDRSGLASFSYSVGNCVHCHEQHASIGGTEQPPTGPTGGPQAYELFRTLFVDQTSMFCFDCHQDTGSSIQNSMPNQYNYSRIAGGDSNTCPADIQEAFQFVDATGSPQFNCTVTTGSSHFLEDIQSFLTGKWNFGATGINPCSGCHNPHSAQRDPHTAASRGWPVSRPSQHNKDNNVWELWGDEAGEKMSDYTSNYQAPYRNGSTITYEPDGSATQDGFNLTDYVTLCTDCHNATNTIPSTPLGGNLRTINWAAEKHGQGSADGAVSLDNPYSSVLDNKVTACTDCHEPHGAPNVTLIREEVNGNALSGFITTLAAPVAECPDSTVAGNKELGFLCQRCHEDDVDAGVGAENRWCYVHHESGDNPYPLSSCGSCHSMSFTPETPVLMSDRTHKPIGEIKADDKVLSFDFDNNTTCESEVIGVSNHFVNETLEINGVVTTSGHLFALGRDQWLEAGKLKTGDTVLGLAGHRDGLEKIKWEEPVSTIHPEKVEVMEMTLEGPQNFFVIGKENKFLVHNGGGMSCSDSNRNAINCNCCHFHNATDPYGGTGRRTF